MTHLCVAGGNWVERFGLVKQSAAVAGFGTQNSVAQRRELHGGRWFFAATCDAMERNSVNRREQTAPKGATAL
jgi:hypothetical protein